MSCRRILPVEYMQSGAVVDVFKMCKCTSFCLHREKESTLHSALHTQKKEVCITRIAVQCTVKNE